MARLTAAIVVLSLAAGPALAAEITWTGAAGDNQWGNPNNWDAGEVPDLRDDAVIPSGTPLCLLPPGSATSIVVNSLSNHGSMATTANAVSLIVMEHVSNHGTIEMANNNDLNIHCAEGSINNWGRIAAGRVELFANEIGNAQGAHIEDKGRGVKIGSEEVANEGDIRGSGPGVSITCSTLNNWGSILGQDGTGDQNGSDVVVHAPAYFDEGGVVNNYKGGAIAAGVAMGGGQNGKTEVKARKVTNKGYIAGRDPGGGKGAVGLAQVEVGDVHVIADSIDTGGEESGLWAGTLYVRGRTIIVHDLTHEFTIEARDDINFNTTADGSVDFSGTHQGNAIVAGEGAINVFSNTVVEPVEGLDHICDPDPVVSPADTTIVDGCSLCFPAVDSTGMAGTLSVSVVNFGTAPRVLGYSVTSTRGWIVPTTGITSSVQPFDSDSAVVGYTIPAGTGVGERDTVVSIVTIGQAFADTSYSTILCIGGAVGAEDQLSPRASFCALECSPNPFRAWTRIGLALPRTGSEPQNLTVVVYNLAGDIVRDLTTNLASCQTDRGTAVRWDGKDAGSRQAPCGVYIIKLGAGGRRAASRVVLAR